MDLDESQRASQPCTQPSQPYTQQASPPFTQRAQARQGTRVRTDWYPAMDLAMLHTFMDAKKRGLETDNGNYKRVVWRMVIDAVSQRTNQYITKEICDNRWRGIKTTWKKWCKHQQQISGWAFCQERMTYVNGIEVTSLYFNQHPDMRQFQHRGPAYPEITRELLDGRLATGGYQARQQSRREEMRNENSREVGTAEELTLTPTPTPAPFLTPTPTPVAETPIASSQSSIRVSTESSSTQNQPLKRKFADSIDALREVIRDSATAKLISIEQPGDIERATRLFLSEVQELLPRDWKVDGRIPYSRYSKIPLLFRDPNISGLYLGYSAGSMEDRRSFILTLFDSEEQ
ncbi:hypothetical protein EMPG_12976 [Blastomyces silverae]|uniref:Myb/SANT-like domain-containing protein n=1 Tax=Blastomyces silverae TaxID=2060906 RepID=A0A0H1BL80_9EURO|nr:hypothetical protein EMPG_12976 [Blastomyces silverae]